jgi:hypothetical protein
LYAIVRTYAIELSGTWIDHDPTDNAALVMMSICKVANDCQENHTNDIIVSHCLAQLRDGGYVFPALNEIEAAHMMYQQ